MQKDWDSPIFYYANNTKLIAIIAIPATTPYMDKCVSSYFLAAGSSSSNEINTIIPATPAKMTPNITGVKNGARIKYATIAPKGSARPENNDNLNALARTPVA